MNFHWSEMQTQVREYHSLPLLQYRPCPICGSLKNEVRALIEDFQFYSDTHQNPNRVILRDVQCLQCFAIFRNPVFSEVGLQILFQQAGASYGATIGRSNEHRDWMQKNALFKKGKRILDIGCFDGSFLASLPKNLTKMGVDIDAPAVERGKKMYADHSIEFIVSDFENFTVKESPDAVTMFHVLEHLAKPKKILEHLRSVSHKNTKLFVEVPIVESSITNDICGFFSPHHFTHFSKTSLLNCLNSSGWEIIEAEAQQDYNGFRVLAKPAPSIQYFAGNPEDIITMNEYLSHWHQATAQVNRILLSLKDLKKCIIWGGGTHTEYMYHLTTFFHQQTDRQYFIVDSDIVKHGHTWRGLPIYSPQKLQNADVSDLPLVISSYGSQNSIANAAISLGVRKKNIIKMYDYLKVY